MAVSMKELLEAGVHFGHRTQRWNPKMRPYIFTERSGIHIIDLQQTLAELNAASKRISDVVAKGGTVLFVGTKRQAQATIRAEAERCQMPYVNERWLGGTLTNWATIRQRLEYLLTTERKMDSGEFKNYTKKERLSIQRDVDKLNRRIGGLKVMRKLPDIVFVVDTSLEDLAVIEATRLHIPVVGMVDTNADPTPIEYVIPSNDDAIRSVKLVVSVIADAVMEGIHVRDQVQVDSGVSKGEMSDMEQYLGPSTLAKLRSVDDDDSEIDGEFDTEIDGEIDEKLASGVVDAELDQVVDEATDVQEELNAVAESLDNVDLPEDITAAGEAAGVSAENPEAATADAPPAAGIPNSESALE